MSGGWRRTVVNGLVGLFCLVVWCASTCFAAQAPARQTWGLAAMQPGQRLVAEVNYRNQGQSDLRPLFNDLQQEQGDDTGAIAAPGMVRTVQAELNGPLELTMLYRGDAYAVLFVRMSGLRSRLAVDGRSSSQSDSAVKAMLAAGAWLRLGADGTVQGVWFARQPDRIARSLITTLLALLQQAAPSAPDQRQWEQEEQDQAGRYLASYQRENAQLWRKRKLNYRAEAAVAGAGQRQQITYRPQGELRIRFAPNRRLQEIDGAESLLLYAGERQVGSSQTTFRLTRTKLTTVADRARAELRRQFEQTTRDSDPQPLFQPQGREENLRLLYRQKLGDQTLDGLLEELQALEKAANGGDDTELYLKFKALIYLQPEKSYLLAQRVAAVQTRSRTFRLLVSALAAIGHADAQQALLRVIAARSTDSDTLVELLPLLGMFEQPTNAVEATLRDYAYRRQERDLNFTAQLALGVLAGKLGRYDTQRAQRLLDEFLARYRQPSTSDDVSRVVLVLGNAGLVQYLPQIRTYLNDRRAEVRVDVVHALRRFPLADVGEQLMLSLTADRDATVRYEAANALGYMQLNMAWLQQMQERYRQEPVSGVRSEIVKTVWQFVQPYPQVRSFVAEVSEKDTSDEVRKVAKGLIGR